MALVIVPVVALLLLTWQPALDPGGDNAEYLRLARSLATGHGYTTLGDPVPRHETQRPPGYPAFLAIFMRLFGERLWVLNATSMLLLLASAWLAWGVLRRQSGTTLWLTATAVGLFLWNLQILDLAGTVGSEMLYTALAFLALLALLRFMGDKDRDLLPYPAGCQPANRLQEWIWLGIAILACAASVYVRPNGLTLVPAFGIYLALHKQWRALLVGALGVAMLLAPLAVMQYRGRHQGHTYMADAMTVETDEGEKQAGSLLPPISQIGSRAQVAHQVLCAHEIVRRG